MNNMTRKNLFIAFLNVLFLLLGNGVFAQQSPSAQAVLDTNAIMIGDQIGLHFKVTVPKGFQLYWPTLQDTLAPHIELIAAQKIDSISLNNWTQYQQKLTITSFDSGAFTVPSFIFHLQNESTGAVDSLLTREMELHVYTPMVDTTKAFKIIKGPESVPYTFDEILPWVIVVLGIIAGIILIIWFVRSRKKGKPMFNKKPKPKLPPHQLAIQKLEALRINRIWQSGKIKEYYTNITDIMREYFTDRFLFEAWEMTSDEIINELKKKKINEQALEKITFTLELSDLVKFAKAKPDPLEHDTALNHCIDFVNETRPAPVIVEENKEEIQEDENQKNKEE